LPLERKRFGKAKGILMGGFLAGFFIVFFSNETDFKKIRVINRNLVYTIYCKIAILNNTLRED
jgi:hypothetical protein